MFRWLIGLGVVGAASAYVLITYWEYVVNPWTRDGQVMAQVIEIKPRVTGPLVRLPIEDNQYVEQGEIIFEIDPRTFRADLEQAHADHLEAEVKLDNAKTDERRFRAAAARGSGAVSEIDLELKIDERRAREAELLASEAHVESARLDLEFTQYRAPVNGYITNLTKRLGSQAVANHAFMALVDTDSFWIHGYFRETVIADVSPGDRAIVTLMTYPDRPLEGRVESIGWAIEPDDGTTGQKLLPKISPTFEWIRLAQRIPVRIYLDQVPDDVKLRVGMTATVLVLTGTAGSEADGEVAAAPRIIQ